tara:strand:- start:102 stop:719 length:618 start_codon:yes stop_codon:yes gene_type:complete
MKNIIVSLGGECSIERNQLEEYDFVIGVDSGTNYLYKLFLIPNLIIGDLDSINTKTLERAEKDSAEIISYETDKDKTDLELALDYLKINEAKNITVIGGESGDLDHLFGNLLSIAAFHKKEYIEWKQANQNIIFPNSELININIGKLFSLMPLSNLEGVSINGGKWNIKNENINFGSTKALRNIANQDLLKVRVKSGNYCLVIEN